MHGMFYSAIPEVHECHEDSNIYYKRESEMFNDLAATPSVKQEAKNYIELLFSQHI